MIGIRSITYFMSSSSHENDMKLAMRASQEWDIRYPLIRTQRICLEPLHGTPNEALYKSISKMCEFSSIRWFNLPIDVLNGKGDDYISYAVSLLKNFPRLFVNIQGLNGNFNVDVIKQYYDIMMRTSRISPNGKDNFRLGLSVNVPAYGPFFPFTMSGGKCSFSIALELTQEINQILKKAQSLDIKQIQKLLTEIIKPQISAINLIALEIERKTGLCFHGFDFSIAPIIGKNGSVISILNNLGIYNFGQTGTMFATAILTDIIKSFKNDFPSVGFSGVMYSVLEDLELCTINNQRGVSLENLITLSTMCGCGVDMVPVREDITYDEILTICLEVYGIATKLDKPLGIRILPIPGCKKNQVVYTRMNDDADFIANTLVIETDINLISAETDFSFLSKYYLREKLI